LYFCRATLYDGQVAIRRIEPRGQHNRLRLVVIAAFAFVFACASRGQLHLPPVDKAEAALVLFVPRNASLGAFAVPWSRADGTSPFAIESGTEYDLYALLYECSLQLMALENQPYILTRNETRRALPSGSFQILKSSVTDFDQLPWSDHTSDVNSRSLLSSWRLYAESLGECDLEQTPSTFEIEGTEGSQLQPLAVAIDRDSLLVGAEHGPFYKVSLGDHVRLNLPPDTPGLAGYRDPTGAIWLFGKDGRIVRGHIDSGFEEVARGTRTASGALVAALVGPKKGEASDVFLATNRPKFQHFVGDRWIGEDALAAACDSGPPVPLTAAWLSAGSAVALLPSPRVSSLPCGGTMLFMYVDNGAVPESVDLRSLFGCMPGELGCDYPWIVGVWPQRGIILASHGTFGQEGRLVYSPDPRSPSWNEIDRFAAPANTLVAFNETIVAGDQTGVMHRYAAIGTNCARAITTAMPTAIVPIRGALVTVSKNVMTLDPQFPMRTSISVTVARTGSCLAEP
jgi:hypothetical protein